MIQFRGAGSKGLLLAFFVGTLLAVISLTPGSASGENHLQRSAASARSLPTLPPTWTLTPIPPTATPTSSPAPTLTPTITPTYRADQICAEFTVFAQPGQDTLLTWAEAVTFAWLFPVDDVEVSLRVTRRGSQEGFAAAVPGPNPAIVQIPYRVFPQTGVYTWSITPNDASGRALRDCAARGRFTVVDPYDANTYWSQHP